MVVQQAVYDELRGVSRDSEANSDKAAFLDRVVESGIHTDDLSINIHQRATGVAVVDSCIDLEVVVERRVLNITVQSADDSTRHRRPKPERVANCEYMVTYPQAAAVTPCQGGKLVIDLYFDDREVNHRCNGNELPFGPFTGIKHDRDLHRVIRDVLVGDDDACRIDDKSGAVCPDPPDLAPSSG